MSPTKIKILLLRAGLKQTDLAREYGCTHVMVHRVVTGKGRSRGIQRLIARKLGIPVKELFPEPRLAA